MAGTPSHYINSGTDGTFWFTPAEWIQMRTEGTDVRLIRLQADFEEDVGFEACVRLNNRLTALFLTETH